MKNEYGGRGRTFLANAFSLNMIQSGYAVTRPISGKTARHLAGVIPGQVEDTRLGTSVQLEPDYTPAICIVGHKDIMAIINDSLGTKYRSERKTVSLSPGDGVVVGQYIGPRLPEGTTELPEGAVIKWFRVDIVADDPLDMSELNQVKKNLDSIHRAACEENEYPPQEGGKSPLWAVLDEIWHLSETFYE